MGKKNTCKANKMKEREIVNYRITILIEEGNYREFLVSGDSFKMDGGYVSIYKGNEEIAAFRCVIAIENMNEALAWGEKFEKLALHAPSGVSPEFMGSAEGKISLKDCCDPLL